MADKSAALFRASNIEALDYPWHAALEAALTHFDEVVVVVDLNSVDKTVQQMTAYASDRRGVVLSFDRFVLDRGWQERWWNEAASRTDAEWLAWMDLDEVIDPRWRPRLHDLLDDPACKLIHLPFVHLYATSKYKIDFPMKSNTRIGRRSVGFRMFNKCTDEHPTHSACSVVYDGGKDAHAAPEDVMRTTSFPVLHYGWCRTPAALAISQYKHRAWYANEVADLKLPDVMPHDFKLETYIAAGSVTVFDGLHPPVMRGWFTYHEYEWAAMDFEAQFSPEAPAIKRIFTVRSE